MAEAHTGAPKLKRVLWSSYEPGLWSHSLSFGFATNYLCNLALVMLHLYKQFSHLYTEDVNNLVGLLGRLNKIIPSTLPGK